MSDEVRMSVSGKYEFTVIREMAEILYREFPDRIIVTEIEE